MAAVDDVIARLEADEGYHVVRRTDHYVELERKNSWLSVVIFAVLSPGGPTTFRTERIHVHTDGGGEPTVSLHPLHDEA